MLINLSTPYYEGEREEGEGHSVALFCVRIEVITLASLPFPSPPLPSLLKPSAQISRTRTAVVSRADKRAGQSGIDCTSKLNQA